MRLPVTWKALKYALKLALIRRSVASYWALRRSFFGPLEPEMAFVDAFADPRRVAIDVGANFGAWSDLLARRFAACHAFEPQSRLASALAGGAPANLFVHCNAVSDRAGPVRLRVPTFDLGRSTIDRENQLVDLDDPARRVSEVEVRSVRLDDLGLGDTVAFVKIDVEGHEAAVLRGASRLLDQSRPAILVETEDRHHAGAPAEVRALLTAARYAELRLPGRNLLFIAIGRAGG